MLNTINKTLPRISKKDSSGEHIIAWIHSEENFNFLWLDYQGAFSYYTRDREK
jgi:hypothetical protein